jgi:hypothetical protein
MAFARAARQAVAAVGAIAAFSFDASSARADFGDGPSGTWLSTGANVGAALHAGKAALVLGAEASVVGWAHGGFMGLYADGLRDFGEDRTRFSLGPELGYWVFGLDFGYLADVGEGRFRHGGVIRPFLTIAVVTPYARFGFREERDGGLFQELGVLLKWPFKPPRLRARGSRPVHAATPRPKHDPDIPLPLEVTLLREHGERGPVAVVGTERGVEWVAFDGQRGVLSPGDVRWVMVDDRAGVIWFLVHTLGSSDLRVIDLKVLNLSPVSVVTGLGQGDFVGVAYQEPDGKVTRLLDETGKYEGRVELLLGPGDPTLRYEKGIHDQVVPPGDGTAPPAEGARNAAIAPTALPLLRKLVARGAGRNLALPVAEVAPLPRVTSVPESRCGQAELCGTAEAVPGTRYQRVLVSHACGDACHARFQLYDPDAASQAFVDVKTWRRSKTPIDEGEPPNLVDAWVSRDGRALVMDGVVYDLRKGPLFGGGTPRRYGGGFLGGAYRLE